MFFAHNRCCLGLGSLEGCSLEALQLDLLPGLVCRLRQGGKQHVAVERRRHYSQEPDKARLPVGQPQQPARQRSLHTHWLLW